VIVLRCLRRPPVTSHTVECNRVGRIKERSDGSADPCDVGGSASLDPPYSRRVNPALCKIYLSPTDRPIVGPPWSARPTTTCYECWRARIIAQSLRLAHPVAALPRLLEKWRSLRLRAHKTSRPRACAPGLRAVTPCHWPVARPLLVRNHRHWADGSRPT
jgi:hypothetical protein